MSDQLSISLSAMRNAVRRWNSAAIELQRGRDRTASLEIKGYEAGTFSLALEKYQPAPGYFHDRLNEGAAIFEDIASVLQSAYEQYRATDVDNQGKLRQLESDLD